jgi:phytoene dehydrogenase-like protein
MTSSSITTDVVVVGGGHNGLVAAAYLAKAGLKVRLFEGSDQLGGATASKRVFDGIDAKLSRYSYLVSLLPDQIVTDLSLNFETITRTISSFTPWQESSGDDKGLLISNDWNKAKDAFDALGLRSEGESWRSFYDSIASVAPTISKTFLKPLPTRQEMRDAIGEELFELLFVRPLGESLERYFKDDRVKGIVLTDGLIGTFTDPHEPSLLANRCFLYHLVGNGDGQWRVPRGGMGSLVTELRRVAEGYGVIIETGKPVTAIESGRVSLNDSTIETRFIVAACSPRELARLRGLPESVALTPGSQLKVNMVLTRLPRLKSGVDPRDAFAGTFHIDESFDQLQLAYREAMSGSLPETIPAEIYCHTLTDPSILSNELVAAGYHTLTLFALHTPYSLFISDVDPSRNDSINQLALKHLMRQLNAYLIDPIEECLARDAHGDLAIEVKSPVDLEREIGLPLGNIFHADLTFPFREEDEGLQWGSETDNPTIFLAGAGSRRGGGVSGIGGHNAAMAILSYFSNP